MKVVYYALFAVGASGMMDKLAQLMKNLPAGMAGNMQDMAMKLDNKFITFESYDDSTKTNPFSIQIVNLF